MFIIWRILKVISPSVVSRCTVLFYAIVVTSVLASCTKEQDKNKVGQTVSGTVSYGSTLVATIADEDTPPPVVPGHEADPALSGKPPSFQVIFSESGNTAAYVASRNGKFYVVHNLTKGKEYSAVGTIVLSSDGKRIAYGAVLDGKARMVLDSKEGKAYDTVLSPEFSPDGRHIVYQAKEGDKWYIVVDNTPSAGTIASYTTPEFSSDSSRIVYVETADSNSKMKLIVSDLTFINQNVKWSIGDQLFTTNSEKTRIAAVQVVKNKFRVIDFDFSTPDVAHEGRLYDVIENLTLSKDGKSMSYCALDGRRRLIILDNKVEKLPVGRTSELPLIRPDKKGVGLLLGLQTHISLHQAFIDIKDHGKSYDEAVNLTYSKDGNFAFAARTGNKWFIVVNGIEGPIYDRVVEPLFSPYGKYVAYRARNGSNRFVLIADAKDGKIIKKLPPYEQVSGMKFTADNKSIAFGVKDGNKLIWKVEPL